MGTDDSKKAATTKEMVVKYMGIAAEKAPKAVSPYIEKAAPFVAQAVDFIEKLIPILIKYYNKLLEMWKKLEPYKPDLLLPSFIGLIMCFFGGSFLTLIATVEAYTMVGYDTTIECIKTLISDFTKVQEAMKKDDEKDDDGDGTPDVLQVSNQELIQRKMLIFLKVLDPKRVTDALTGISSGLLAVVATLKLKFAKTITLGHAIGEVIEKPAQHYLVPILEKMIPEEYQKWISPAISYSIKSFAISIAWTVQRVISAFHSAMRGGLMFSRNIIHYLSEMGYIKINHEDTYIDEIVGYGIAALGLIFQLSYGFGLPFPLNILLFPVTMIEYILIWMVNSSS